MVNDLHVSHWIVMISLLFLSNQALANVSAQVDRTTISIDETISLSIEVNGDDNGDPDIAPLQRDFEILSRNQSNSYSLINGSIDSKSTWFLTLRPRHAGTLTIPALLAGKKKTTPITIQVTKASTRQSPGGTVQGNLWIDMSVDPKQIKVQQQAIITLRIFQAATLNQAQLSEPASDQAIIIRLGKDKNYQINRDGKNWAVTERRYAIFPQQHGVLTIKPVQLDGTIMAGRSYGSPFQSTSPIRVRSNSEELSVEAIPATWKSDTWLPAKQVELIEDWPSGEFKVGDSITRTLTLKANGLSFSQLPELKTLLPDHLKAYADKPVLQDNPQNDGVHGSRQQKLAILATQPGTFILPPIDIRWWNTSTQSMQTTSLPARTFKVIAAPVQAHQPYQSAPTVSNQTPTQLNPVMPSNSGQQLSAWWKWLALLSSLGWLVTLIVLFRQLRKSSQPRTEDVPLDLSALKESVRVACAANTAKACEQALVSFANAQWPDQHINNLAAIASHCDAALAQEIKNLELYLYANQKHANWSAEQLQAAFEQANFTITEAVSKTTALPALYPK
jgi:hypothetical protein